jgi:hypothetical protein
VTGPQTPAPAALPRPPSLQPGRVTRPAGFQGGDARAKWKAALAAHNAAKRRGRFTRAAKKTGPGMIRRMPDGDDAA